MRLFIAVCLDRTMRQAVLSVRDALGTQLASGRLTRPENLHLTLAFLGEQPPARVGAAQRAMEAAFDGAFDLTLDRPGCFRQREGELWWLGVARTPELMGLAARLGGALRAEGFSLERRAFSPHLTLVRQARFRPGFDPAQLPCPHAVQSVEQIVLMESARPGGVLTYTPVLCVPESRHAVRG